MTLYRTNRWDERHWTPRNRLARRARQRRRKFLPFFYRPRKPFGRWRCSTWFNHRVSISLGFVISEEDVLTQLGDRSP